MHSCVTFIGKEGGTAWLYFIWIRGAGFTLSGNTVAKLEVSSNMNSSASETEN